MKEQSEENTKKEVIEKKTIRIFRGHLFIKLVIILLLVLAVIAGIAGLRKGGGQPAESESKTTRIGFENIGQMVTQAAYCTEMNVTKDSRKLFGMTIPFTQSEYIYSYDVEVRAGLDFSQIEWSVDEDNSTIQVRLPQVQILSSEINTDTFKVYHEEESIFTPIKLADNNDALKTLIKMQSRMRLQTVCLKMRRATRKRFSGDFLQMSMIYRNIRLNLSDKRQKNDHYHRTDFCT